MNDNQGEQIQTGNIETGGSEYLWHAPFGQKERDLLRVATAVLHVDRVTERGARGARDVHRALQAGDNIDLTIAVEQPDRWNALATSLADLLNWMSSDCWKLRFIKASPPPGQQQPLLPDDVAPGSKVVLFSGGLDSVLGVFLSRVRHSEPLVAVSVRGNPVRARAQQVAMDALTAGEFHVPWVRYRHALRGGRAVDESQRTRAFVFLAVGAAVASVLELDTVVSYETGVGVINPPFTEAQVGSDNTRAMHPGTLLAMETLVERALDRQIRIDLPLFFLTKGEVCRDAGSDAVRLATAAMSCDEGERGKSDPTVHCGLCTSCLFRRVALHHAVGDKDPTTYRDVETRRHGRFEIDALELQALRMREAAATWTGLLAVDPSLRLVGDYWVQRGMSPSDAEAELCDLFQRYTDEVVSFLSDSRPAVEPRSNDGRKRGGRNDLFA